ncbi:hypothetical protein AB0E55_26575 [Amycolatopsis keratiniphila]|uniref:Uncharacterized protein n=2 Tax=Amycolatopsis keratiniphila TaxID=129921 RepID=R4T4Z7_9PSEU|nr:MULTISPECIES: hypothetical protein [Amycolatopsis]AGM05743.1 hypothetical protein AORI_3158 [Amycolatopsis keratiniphila]OLZ58330.1 hypothetical protein BS330_12185 [Amycolatopsis keratiniphila subsp. nogabecina]ONF69977.1 hypothetical protein AVR91_0217070 [Amycolatopsis keratiniphila subsp. keratiniphila]RSN39253.1 hypothetical protein DMC64_39730 [Amycolatopsis sp. WAC 04197]SDU28428.1 hypothetical protein SAMN04489733_2702 [Amycolatopsis keratiniphila]
MINYDGKRFRKVSTDPDAPVTLYRQKDDLVWAELSGGGVRLGSLTGKCGEDGTIDMAYTMVLASGQVISGHSTNTPEFLPDGRIRLNEVWERYGNPGSRGTSAIEEVAE